MQLGEDDLRRAAEKLISEFGPKAAPEAERQEARSAKKGLGLTANAWRRIRAIVVKLQQDQPD